MKAKDTIKSIPFVYNALWPWVSRFRRKRDAIRQANRQATYRRRLDLFRQYCRELPDFVSNPIFVKVGANDGITGDPCSDILLADSRWKGLLIEPVPYCIERLKKNFNDIQRFSVEQVAIGPSASKAPFYYVASTAREAIPNLPSWFDQLGSFNRNHIIKHLDGILEPFILELDVRIVPLADAINANGIQHVHLLHIDTEGYDYEVLKTLDFSRAKPIAILIEHRHLLEAEKLAMLQLLRDNRYDISDCGEDYFALNRNAYKRLQRAGRLLSCDQCTYEVAT